MNQAATLYHQEGLTMLPGYDAGIDLSLRSSTLGRLQGQSELTGSL